MKIGFNTQKKIDLIKDEAAEIERKLENLLVRLSEHPGTKKKASKLERVKVQLEMWRRVA